MQWETDSYAEIRGRLGLGERTMKALRWNENA